jgi:hypothetical protein
MVLVNVNPFQIKIQTAGVALASPAVLVSPANLTYGPHTAFGIVNP